MRLRRIIRPGRRRFPAPPTLMLLGILFLLALRSQSKQPGDIVAPADGEEVFVIRAVDGDTLLLGDGRRVRLLGVDTPETRHPRHPAELWGEEASAWTAAKVDRQQVKLEYDRERFDDYGRWLAYVYLGDECLNETIIRAGFSEAEIAFPFRSDMKRRFEKAEELAQAEQLGIWSAGAASTGPANSK